MAKYSSTSSDDPLTVSEPTVAYQSANFFELANRGVSKKYIQNVLNITKLTVADIIEILPISIDTYKRKSAFNPQVTEKVLEIEEVYQKGLDTFGEGFYQWMDTPNVALGNIKPKVLLKNSFGIRRLLNQIGRIEHGILA